LVSNALSIHLSEEHRIIQDTRDLDETGAALLTTVRACADQEFSKKLSERLTKAWKIKRMRLNLQALLSGTAFRHG
jgi:hypothetical protein